MSFGFSVGDFIAAGNLVKDIISALRESSVSEYRDLVLELHGLQRALHEIEHLRCQPGQEGATNSIKVASLMCQYPLDEFAGKLRKFESLGVKSGGSTSKREIVKTWGIKLKWGFTMEDEVRNLRAYLIAHVGSLNMRLLAQGLTSASMAAEQSTKAQTGVVHSLNDSHKAIVAAHKAVVEIEPITRSNNNILTRLSKLVTQDMLPQLKTLMDLADKVWNSNMRIITIVTKLQTSVSSPDLRFTWVQEPVRFEDALGRIFPVPSEYSWGKLRAIIQEQFSTGPGREKVLAGEYELFNSMDTTRNIAGGLDFESLIPGMRITMAILIGQYDQGALDRCPRPGCRSKAFTSLEAGGKSCFSCKIWFDIARKPLPRPYRPDILSAHRSKSEPCLKRRLEDVKDGEGTEVGTIHKKLRTDRRSMRNIRIHRTQLPKTPRIANVRHSSIRQAPTTESAPEHQEPMVATVPAVYERQDKFEWTPKKVPQDATESEPHMKAPLATCPEASTPSLTQVHLFVQAIKRAATESLKLRMLALAGQSSDATGRPIDFPQTIHRRRFWGHLDQPPLTDTKRPPHFYMHHKTEINGRTEYVIMDRQQGLWRGLLYSRKLLEQQVLLLKTRKFAKEAVDALPSTYKGFLIRHGIILQVA